MQGSASRWGMNGEQRMTKEGRITVMERFKTEVGSEGLSVPKDIMERWGIREGTPVVLEFHRSWLEIRPEAVTEEQLENRALSYLLQHVGDALAVGKPQDKGDRWRIPVMVSYTGKCLGHLVFTGSGALLPDQSTSSEEMLARIDEA